MLFSTHSTPLENFSGGASSAVFSASSVPWCFLLSLRSSIKFIALFCLDQITTIPVSAQAALSNSSQNTPTNSIYALVFRESNERTTLLSHTIFEDHWIVDTDASDHMTGSQTVFFSYELWC